MKQSIRLISPVLVSWTRYLSWSLLGMAMKLWLKLNE